MTEKQLYKELMNLSILSQNQDNVESIHEEADQLLIRFIDNSLITYAYNKIRKWYA